MKERGPCLHSGERIVNGPNILRHTGNLRIYTGPYHGVYYRDGRPQIPTPRKEVKRNGTT